MTWLLDAILVLVILEAIGLLALQRARRRRTPPVALLSTLAAGFFLLLCLRLSLSGAPWFVLCAVLALSLVAHLVDLRRRFAGS